MFCLNEDFIIESQINSEGILNIIPIDDVSYVANFLTDNCQYISKYSFTDQQFHDISERLKVDNSLDALEIYNVPYPSDIIKSDNYLYWITYVGYHVVEDIKIRKYVIPSFDLVSAIREPSLCKVYHERNEDSGDYPFDDSSEEYDDTYGGFLFVFTFEDCLFLMDTYNERILTFSENLLYCRESKMGCLKQSYIFNLGDNKIILTDAETYAKIYEVVKDD